MSGKQLRADVFGDAVVCLVQLDGVERADEELEHLQLGVGFVLAQVLQEVHYVAQRDVVGVVGRIEQFLELLHFVEFGQRGQLRHDRLIEVQVVVVGQNLVDPLLVLLIQLLGPSAEEVVLKSCWLAWCAVLFCLSWSSMAASRWSSCRSERRLRGTMSELRPLLL